MDISVRKILVPVDFSHVSSLAVRYASSLATAFGADMVILTVADDDSDWAVDLSDRMQVRERWREERVREGERKLETFCAQLVDSVSHSYEVRVGDSTEEIVDACGRHEVDLLVLGAHGTTGVVSDWLGGTAYGVSKKAPCPVLMVKLP